LGFLDFDRKHSMFLNEKFSILVEVTEEKGV